MSANLNQGSARIYQFPAGGRAALGGRSYGEAKSVARLSHQNVVAVYDQGADGPFLRRTTAIRISTATRWVRVARFSISIQWK